LDIVNHVMLSILNGVWTTWKWIWF
jgi:hypothetical protein